MIKYVQRAFAFFVALALLGNSLTLAILIDPDDPPEIPEEYIHLSSISASISFSSGVATVSSYGRSSVPTDTVHISIKLQRMENYTWTTIKTWSFSDTSYCSPYATWNVFPGYTYRNFTTVTVYTSSGNYVETVYKTSSQYY